MGWSLGCEVEAFELQFRVGVHGFRSRGPLLKLAQEDGNGSFLKSGGPVALTGCSTG